MTATRFRGLLALVLVGLGLPGCALLREVFPSPPAGAVPGSLKIEGGLAKAAGVAADDLLSLRQKEAEAASVPENALLLQCFARLESYDLHVGTREDRYVVRIVPRPERCISADVQMYGGGATYEIHGSDFTILRKDLDE